MYKPKELFKRLQEDEHIDIVTKDLSDAEFSDFYFRHLNWKGTQYWDITQTCLCDRCRSPIKSRIKLRIMHGSRLHPSCFRENLDEWIERGTRKGYVDSSARKYFERVAKLLC